MLGHTAPEISAVRDTEGEVSMKKSLTLGALVVAGALATAGVAVAYWDTDGHAGGLAEAPRRRE